MPRRTIAYLHTPTLDGRIIHGMTFPTGAVRVAVLTAEGRIDVGWAQHFAIEGRRVTAALSTTIPGLGPEIDTYGQSSGEDNMNRLVWETVLLTGVVLGDRPAWEGLIEPRP